MLTTPAMPPIICAVNEVSVDKIAPTSTGVAPFAGCAAWPVKISRMGAISGQISIVWLITGTKMVGILSGRCFRDIAEADNELRERIANGPDDIHDAGK